MRCVTETSETMQLCKWYDGDALQYSDEKYILPGTEKSTRLIDQIQSYTAMGKLKYSYQYTYTAAGYPETMAYYDAANALKWFYAFEYVTVGTAIKLSAQYEYDAAGVLQWAKKYAWNDTGLATGELKSAVRFSQSSAIECSMNYYFLSDSKKWNMEISRGSGSASIGPGNTPSVYSAGAKNSDSVPSHGRLPLLSPSIPVSPVLPVPSDLSSTGLLATGYRFQYEDTYGVSQVSLDKDWYPVLAYRTDSRIGTDPLLVELSYDSAHRIVQKATSYGSTKALVVTVAYDKDNFPTSIGTSGAAMMLPLEYSVEYGTNHQIKKISVTSGGSLLRYFTYNYTAPTKPVVMPTSRSIDPFAFIDALLSSGVTICEFDGGDKPIEAFVSRQADPVPGATTTGVIFDVHIENPSGAVNGSFTVTIDSSGIPVALSSKKADGTELWNREFGAQTVLLNRVKTEITDFPVKEKLTGFDNSYGRLLETYLPATGETPSAGIAKNFMYDLLF